jgi:hypothetical protein
MLVTSTTLSSRIAWGCDGVAIPRPTEMIFVKELFVPVPCVCFFFFFFPSYTQKMAVLLLALASAALASTLPVVDLGYERHQALSYNVREVPSFEFIFPFPKFT